MRTKSDIEGFILIGGASRRMGQDKARLIYNKQTFVDRIYNALLPVVARTTLVTSNRELTGWRLPQTTDVYPGWGAFGGLHAALTCCKSDWALVVACDLPMVSSELFKRLADYREGADAVAPVQADGFPQPLCAFYKVSTSRECAQHLIASGERRPVTLLRAIQTRWVSMDELRDLPGSSFLLSNVNTPSDFERLKENLKGDQREESAA
jgi:molybdopterin-guanine dinucleotide biosynthesis protein A